MSDHASKGILICMWGCDSAVQTSQMVSPQDGAAFIRYYFSQPLVVLGYLIWYVALWFHLTHGFWSAIHTIGWNNQQWFNRWKCISTIVATLICVGFAFVTLFFYAQSLSN